MIIHVLCRHAPRSRETVVVLGKELQHPVHVASQEILATNFNHSRKVVDFLQKKETGLVYTSLIKGGTVEPP